MSQNKRLIAVLVFIFILSLPAFASAGQFKATRVRDGGTILAKGYDIERGKVFSSDADRNHLLERLGEVPQDTKTLCYVWALGLVINI